MTLPMLIERRYFAVETLIWSSPTTTGNRPCKRRAHTTCVYNNRIYVFGGGDGLQALNDTFELDLATMHWSEIKTTGQIPLSRGYHTSNIFKSQMIVFGGSDGHECFSDVHVLDLGRFALSCTSNRSCIAKVQPC